MIINSPLTLFTPAPGKGAGYRQAPPATAPANTSPQDNRRESGPQSAAMPVVVETGRSASSQAERIDLRRLHGNANSHQHQSAINAYQRTAEMVVSENPVLRSLGLDLFV